MTDRRTHPDPFIRRVAAYADHAAGRDLAWARQDPDASVRQVAACADHVAGRDLDWARQDPDARVRWAPAYADQDAGRDLTWALQDPHPFIRRVARFMDEFGDPELSAPGEGQGENAMTLEYTTAHALLVEDEENGDVIDVLYFCGDGCHREYCREYDHQYRGWSGCHEIEYDAEQGRPVCVNCGEEL